MTFGRHDGEPFLHGHGVWRHEDGLRAAGHVMPKDSQFAEPVEAEAWIMSGAIMDQLEDSETRSVCSRLCLIPPHRPSRRGAPFSAV